MLVYITGLATVISAIELTLALVLGGRGVVPPPSESFWMVYLRVDIKLLVAGGKLVSGSRQAFRSQRPSARTDARTPDQPQE
jgi:hypothetical protein